MLGFDLARRKAAVKRATTRHLATLIGLVIAWPLVIHSYKRYGKDTLIDTFLMESDTLNARKVKTRIDRAPALG